jgi:branched-chain amino acid transport system permease protein
VLKSFSEWLNELKQAGAVLNLGFWKYNLADLPSQLDPTKFERLVFGLILILMMIFRPSGLIPESRHRLEMEKED